MTPQEASVLQAYLQQCVPSSILHVITLVQPVVPLCWDLLGIWAATQNMTLLKWKLSV